jgi:hypothetical protein
MRCIVDLSSPKSVANLRHDQCVLPSGGLCCTRLMTRACTAGVAGEACFLYVGLAIHRDDAAGNGTFTRTLAQYRRSISRYDGPSARARIKRARNTSPAGKLRDCALRSSSSRSSEVTYSNSRLCATSKWGIKTEAGFIEAFY